MRSKNNLALPLGNSVLPHYNSMDLQNKRAASSPDALIVVASEHQCCNKGERGKKESALLSTGLLWEGYVQASMCQYLESQDKSLGEKLSSKGR